MGWDETQPHTVFDISGVMIAGEGSGSLEFFERLGKPEFCNCDVVVVDVPSRSISGLCVCVCSFVGWICFSVKYQRLVATSKTRLHKKTGLGHSDRKIIFMEIRMNQPGFHDMC